MSMPFPEPTTAVGELSDVLAGYLTYFRARLVDKIRSLPAAGLRQSRVPSGWTPLQLLKHLTFVERRWLQWGFEGGDVADPWGDERGGRWYVDESESLADLVDGLERQAQRSATTISTSHLHDVGRPGPRWDGAPPATLERVLLHLVQEYARHLGQLDVVVELAGGVVGE